MNGHYERCRHEGCRLNAQDGAIYCAEHIGASHRCVQTRVKNGVTQRCKKAALRGLDRCEKHGGRLPIQRARHERAEALTAMQRFVRPYEGDLDLMQSFEDEYRRCLGRIAWYDQQLSQLADPQALVWGRTEEKVVRAGEYPGTDTTYAAKVNMFEELQRWERKHLLDMQKVALSVGLEQKRLDLMTAQVDRTYEAIVTALVKLGLDPTDERVREALAEALAPREDPAIAALTVLAEGGGDDR